MAGAAPAAPSGRFNATSAAARITIKATTIAMKRFMTTPSLRPRIQFAATRAGGDHVLERIGILNQRGPIHGQTSQAYAGRREDGVGERRRRDGSAYLTKPSRGLIALDAVQFDRRGFVDTQASVIVEIALLDGAM